MYPRTDMRLKYFTRLWIDGKTTGGSIVITASMSSQIINQAAENQPLTQVLVPSTLPCSLTNHVMKFLGVLQLLQGGRLQSCEGPRSRVGPTWDKS